MTNINQKVLIVDDDRGVAETLAAVLSLHGYEVRTAFSGKAAIKITDEFQPTTLIIDVVMPGMNGVETASYIRSLFPSCRVLLITGRSAAADLVLRTHALDEGFELLAKPVHPSELMQKL